MTCKSCKGTHKIQLLNSFVECTDCRPANPFADFRPRSDDYVEPLQVAIVSIQARRQDSIARGLTKLDAWHQSVTTDPTRPQMVELLGKFHIDPHDWLFNKDRTERKLDETNAQFRARLSKSEPTSRRDDGLISSLLSCVNAVYGVSHVSYTPKDEWTIEVFVIGGNDHAVARAIWDGLPLVVATVGNTCVAINTERGPVNMYFSRPANT